MKCYSCGYPLHTSKINQCPLCHASFEHICMTCYAPNPKFAKYCLQCGNELLNKTQSDEDIRKSMVIMFADISGFTKLSETLDHEKVKYIVDETFKTLSQVIYDFSGEIDKFIGDCIMVTFGRTLTHVNDIKNSINCALQLHQVIESLSFEGLDAPLKLSIGLNFGEVTLGHVGSVFDSDYTVMGDVVNTAQRIQTAAPDGKTYLSEAIYNEASFDYTFSEAIPIVAKNKSEPIIVYEPLKSLDTKALAPLYNREVELAAVETILLDNKTPCIIGDAGLGKTSLVKHILKNQDDYEKIWFTCEQQFINRPYYGINQLLLNASIFIDKKIETLYAKDSIENSYKKQLLQLNILGQKNESHSLSQLEASVLDNLTKKSYMDLFKYISGEGDKLFVLDDIQWLDHRSKPIVQSLIDNKTCLLILISREDNHFHAVEPVILSPLTLEGVSHMSHHYFSDLDISQNAIMTLHENSQGNPMILKALLNQILICSEAEKNFDECVSESKGLSNSMERLILENLQTLSSNEMTFLRQASVIGKTFNASDFIDYFKCPLESILGLKRFDWLEIVERDQKSLEISFLSDTHKQVVYSAIPSSIKVAYHLEIIESTDDLESKLFHCMMIEKKEAIHQYALTLGAKYLKDYMYLEALSKYEIALEYDLDLKEISSTLFKLYDKLNLSDQAFSLIDSLYQSNSDYEKALLLLKEKAKWHLRIGALDNALLSVQTIKEMAPKGSIIYGYSEMYEGNVARIKGKQEAINHLQSAYDLLTLSDDYDALSEIKRQMGILNIIQGLQNNAQKALEEANSLAQKTGNLNQISRINNNLAMVYFANGIFMKTEEIYLIAIEHAQKLLDERLEMMSRINLAISYMKYGFVEKSRTHLTRALHLAKENKLGYHTTNARVNLVELDFLNDQLNLKDATSFAETLRQSDLPIESALVTMFCQLKQGIEPDHALTVFIEANELELIIDVLDLNFLRSSTFNLSHSIDLDTMASIESKLEQIKYKRILSVISSDILKRRAYIDEAIELSKRIGNTLEIVKSYCIAFKYHIIPIEEAPELLLTQLSNSDKTIYHTQLDLLIKS